MALKKSRRLETEDYEERRVPFVIAQCKFPQTMKKRVQEEQQIDILFTTEGSKDKVLHGVTVIAAENRTPAAA